MNDDGTVDFRFEGKRNPKMKSVWAWIGADKESGEEYVIGADMGFGPMPFVTSMKDLIEKMRPMALQHAREFRANVKLVRFTKREDLESHD